MTVLPTRRQRDLHGPLRALLTPDIHQLTNERGQYWLDPQWNNGELLVVGASLESGGTQVIVLNAALGLDWCDMIVDILGNNISKINIQNSVKSGLDIDKGHTLSNHPVKIGV